MSLLRPDGASESPFCMEGRAIFELIRDSRPLQFRLYSLAASILVNVLALGGLLAVMQLSALHRSSERVMAELQRELNRYRMVLFLPAGMQAMTKTPVRVPETRNGTQKPRHDPAPLKTPDTRLMRHMDPQLADFVRANPGIESILTREIIRDVDNKALDISRLMRRSSLGISFSIGEDGRIRNPRVELSSKVPSIDHLALELIKLLEKYQILWAFKGVQRVIASIRVKDQVSISLQGALRDPAESEEVRRRVQGALAFLRLVLAQKEAAFLLDNATLTAEDNQIVLRKDFEKEPLMAYLMRYYQAQPPK